MKTSAFLFACVLFLAVGTANAGKQSNGNTEIDPDIWVVKAGGLWTKSDSEYGNYRVFVKNMGWEHTRSFLYLQWLRSDDDKQQVIVLKTIPIPEFNEGDWYNIVDINRKDNTFLITYTVRGSQETQKTAVLVPRLPGKYRYVVK